MVIHPTGCGNVPINTGSPEALFSNNYVNIQHKTDIALTLKLHGLKFSCDNMKRLLQAFVNQNPLAPLISEVLKDFQPIKTLKALLEDAKDIIDAFSFWSSSTAAVSLAQEESEETYRGRARERLEVKRYGKALKHFQNHELVSLEGHVVPKSFIGLDAMTTQFVDVGISEVKPSSRCDSSPNPMCESAQR